MGEGSTLLRACHCFSGLFERGQRCHEYVPKIRHRPQQYSLFLGKHYMNMHQQVILGESAQNGAKASASGLLYEVREGTEPRAESPRSHGHGRCIRESPPATCSFVSHNIFDGDAVLLREPVASREEMRRGRTATM